MGQGGSHWLTAPPRALCPFICAGLRHSFPLSTIPSCSRVYFPINCRGKYTFQGRRETCEMSLGDWNAQSAMAVSNCSGPSAALAGHLHSDGLRHSPCAAAAHPALPLHLCPHQNSSSEPQSHPPSEIPAFPFTLYHEALKMLIEEKGEKKSFPFFSFLFPSEQSQQEPSVSASEKNWFCVTLNDWGTTQCNRQRQQATPSTTETFPGCCQCCRSASECIPHPDPSWEACGK